MAEVRETHQFPRIPLFRLFLDDVMLLLFLGVAIYAVSYLIWGIMEIGSVPPFPEELKQQLVQQVAGGS
ncbi:hypothetical protein HRbin21_01506 [bacterium HR21]|jgi:hypothetical protein|nr:hypothetical protein HRbin21_01506 [bacterium HR21]